MLGKQKCRIMKEIRQRIADENDIPYVTRECSFQGACKGTCPRCESELRYLEQQLALRQSLGKRVAVTALCASMALAGASCGPARDEGEEAEYAGEPMPIETELPEEPENGETKPEDILIGEPEPEETELMGDVAYIPAEDAGEADHG